MGRKAFVSSDMAHDEDLFDVSQENSYCTLLWPWLITYFDDWGRGLRSAKRIKSQLFPTADVVTLEWIEEALVLFERFNLIVCYADEEHEYMAIPPEKWFKWQTHIRTDKRNKDNSKYPPIPTDCAQLRATARHSATNVEKIKKSEKFNEVERTLTKSQPSPSLSLSLSPTLSKEREKEQQNTTDADGSQEVNRNISIKDSKAGLVAGFYEQIFGEPMTDLDRANMLLEYMDKGMSLELVFNALTEAKRNNAKKPLSYAEKILRRQFDDGMREVKDLPTLGGSNSGPGEGRAREDSRTDAKSINDLEERFFQQ